MTGLWEKGKVFRADEVDVSGHGQGDGRAGPRTRRWTHWVVDEEADMVWLREGGHTGLLTTMWTCRAMVEKADTPGVEREGRCAGH